MRTRTPSNLLMSSDCAVFSFFSIDEIKRLEFHEGSEEMFVLCDVMKGRAEDNMRDLKHYLDCFKQVPLNKICLLLVTDEDDDNEKDIEALQEQVRDSYGISNILASDCKSSSTLASDLLKIHGGREMVEEKRCYGDFRREKVLILLLDISLDFSKKYF